MRNPAGFRELYEKMKLESPRLASYLDAFCEDPSLGVYGVAKRFFVSSKTIKNALYSARMRLGYIDNGYPTAELVADWWRMRTPTPTPEGEPEPVHGGPDVDSLPPEVMRRMLDDLRREWPRRADVAAVVGTSPA